MTTLLLTASLLASLLALHLPAASSSVSNVLKTRHDTVKNSIGNIR